MSKLNNFFKEWFQKNFTKQGCNSSIFSLRFSLKGKGGLGCNFILTVSDTEFYVLSCGLILKPLILVSFPAKNSQTRMDTQISRVTLDLFLSVSFFVKITENCAWIVKVWSVKSSKIIKTSIRKTLKWWSKPSKGHVWSKLSKGHVWSKLYVFTTTCSTSASYFKEFPIGP